MRPAPAEGTTADDSDEEQGEELWRKAIKARLDGRRDLAAERLREAWAVYKNPFYLCEIGDLEAELDRPRDAAQSFSACLRLLTPEDRKFIQPKVDRYFKDARAKVGELHVEANVPGAEVFVDGKATAKLPLLDPIFLDPGSHNVEVKAPGYQPDLRVAVLSAGTSMLIRMRLEPTRVEVAPPMELAPVEPKPKPKEEARPPVLAPMSASAKAPASIPARDRVPEPAGAPVRAAVILTGLGLSVVGAVAGTAGFMAAGAARSEAKEKYRALTHGSSVCEDATPGPCADAESKIDTALVLTAISVAGVAVSAVGGGLVVYEFVRTEPQASKVNAWLSIGPAPSGGIVRVTGHF